MWTNLEGFRQLLPFELDALLEAPVLITILVGASDNKLDEEERTWSEHLMQVSCYANPKLVGDYFRVAGTNFVDKLDSTLSKLPEDLEMRSNYLKEKLESLDPILDKLAPDLAASLVKSFRELAQETAKASGGFLRIGAISAAEHQWVELPMLKSRNGVGS